MIDYDADDSDIQILQEMLLQYGVTAQMLDLRKYAGATFADLYSIVEAVIKAHSQEETA